MNRLFPFFFLFIMVFNLVVPSLERLRSHDLHELLKFCHDDLEEKSKSEKESEPEQNKGCKEKEKEKESFAASIQAARNAAAFSPENLKNSISSEEERLRSELFAFMPELPPDAGASARFFRFLV